MSSKIEMIHYVIPEHAITNSDLNQRFPEWSKEKIFKKTGIKNRPVCAKNEYASDLAIKAVEEFFLNYPINKKAIDYLVLCGQNHDYLTPSTACIVQQCVGLPKKIGAIDINVGCSGYIYGLSVAHGLIQGGMARHVLLVTATTMAKCVSPNDKGLMCLLGDAATVTLMVPDSASTLPQFVFGTDGSGARELIITNSGMHSNGSKPYLYMNGPSVFNFILEAVPESFQQLLAKANYTINDIDHFIFHQANNYILSHLREKLGIPKSKFLIDMENFGNTSSSSIPILIKRASEKKQLKPNSKLLMMGFGGGYSWGGVIWNWKKE
jgi:3-oxoacyl-[acyl-carrier-protein] synthase III